MSERLETHQVLNALADRYSGEEWAYLQEVRSSTGYVRNLRTADALAMSLWPSRGLELHGFEVKASRSDWVKELKEPQKAEEIFKYCDRWWIAVGDAEIVKPGELPPTWGLLIPRGNKLVVKVEAPKLEAQTLSRNFLAGILRRAKESLVPKTQIDDQLQRKYDEGIATGKKNAEYNIRLDLEELERLKRQVKEFQEKSGLAIHGYRAGQIGEAVRLLMEPHRLDQHLKEISVMIASHNEQARTLQYHLDKLKESQTVSRPPMESEKVFPKSPPDGL